MKPSRFRGLYLLFFLSGFPALLYQIVWQRALFTIFGVNMEAVTVVVCAFMLGLGLGSLCGGWVSRRPGVPLLAAFGGMELAVAGFGFFSLDLFRWVATYSAGASAGVAFFLTFGLVLFPTMLMGATLPLLVTHLVRASGDVGRSVGVLYFVNTLGSAVACFAAALFTMRVLGMTGSVRLAVVLNVGIGLTVLAMHIWGRRGEVGAVVVDGRGALALPLGAAVAVAAAAGFISLGYEIVWYRVYSFVTGGSPECFSFVLGAFLAGIAFGSLGARGGSLRAMAVLVVLANGVGFLSVPFLGWALGEYDYTVTLPVVALGAGLLGATFPMLCQAAVGTDAPGAGLSYLYLANIAGSALGSYVMGFVLMDSWSLRGICLFLLLLGLGAAALIVPRWRMAVVCCGLGGLGVWAAGPLFDQIYERLMYKDEFAAGMRFTDVVETRSGVVTVDRERHIYGGGAHDGVLSTDVLTYDSCIRPFSLSYLHPAPKEILLIGMAGGAWAQITGNHPQLERAVAVEINPGYTMVIGRYPEVAPVLRNPKVRIVIDDGRRWMAAHRDQKFDAILMDTVQHWRAHATNLLSVEMLTLARGMLKPGGVIYYNTTYSDAVQKTGASLFPYALRFGPFLAVSERPLELDEARWREAMWKYTFDGRRVLDPADPRAVARVEQMARYLRTVDTTGNEHLAVEGAESIRRRTAGAAVVTDDNMATEWRR